MNNSLACYHLRSGWMSGRDNMALDEMLLDALRAYASPVLIVRTYQWQEPTLSFGVNQPESNIEKLCGHYQKQLNRENPLTWVRRPTGGRAILHGEDVSFSFITNDPMYTKLSVEQSYHVLMRAVRAAMAELEIPLVEAKPVNSRDYTLSAHCFETRTPSDLVDVEGNKIAGCAQLRREGGLLQHGAAFLMPYQIDEAAFSQALFDAVARQHGLESTASLEQSDLYMHQLGVPVAILG